MSDIKMKFIKRVKQNIKKGKKQMYSRVYDFTKNQKKKLVRDKTANELIKKKIQELVNKKRRKFTNDTETQTLHITDDDEVIASFLSKAKKISFPNKRNDSFGSIKICEKTKNMKTVMTNYFVM